MVENLTMEDYNKKFAAIDEQMRADYEGFLDTCKSYLDGVNKFLSDRVSAS